MSGGLFGVPPAPAQKTKERIAGEPSENDIKHLVEDLSNIVHDVTFVLHDNSERSAARIVLTSRSKYFSGLLNGHMQEGSDDKVKLGDPPIKTVECLEGILEWAYTGGIAKLCKKLAPPPAQATAPAAPAPAPGGGLFGAAPSAAAYGGLFGPAAPAPAPGGGLFGATPASPFGAAPAPGGGLFGAAAPAPAAAAPALDGTAPATEMPKEEDAKTAPSLIQVLCELLGAAQMYQIDGLKDVCSRELLVLVDAHNVTEVLKSADKHDAKKLRAECLTFVGLHRHAIDISELQALDKQLVVEAMLTIPQGSTQLQPARRR